MSKPDAPDILLQQAESAMSRGDLFTAYDVSRGGVEAGHPQERFKYLQVLALARMGDIAHAHEQYQNYGLSASADVDVASLGARLLKDQAFGAVPFDAVALLRAGEAYKAIYIRTGDSFPGVNAATLFLLGGVAEEARLIAEEVLRTLSSPQTYYGVASRAEALLVLGRVQEACDEIVVASGLSDADLGSRATTRRQFSLIANYLNLEDRHRQALLSPLAPPKVFMFCGHIMPDNDTGAQNELANALRAVLKEECALIAYGALASGSDLIIAEEVLEQRGELNVVLPFQTDSFLDQSVVPFGSSWKTRFDTCMDRARSTTFATDMPFMHDPAQFSYGSMMCMGMARLRAQHLGAEVLQIAVWDGVVAKDGAQAGTAVDVANWERSGGRTRFLAPTWQRRGTSAATPPRPPPWSGKVDDVHREVRALIFTDFRGFSKLSESVLPVFWREVMQRMMGVVEQRATDICYANTWGDALYAVVKSARAAAEIALALQESLEHVNYAALGLNAEPHMRLGVHYAPVFRWRGMNGALNYYGTQVSLAARIEPITPPGAVYVTEQFAAVLAMEAPEEFVSRYVGQIPLAKAYGTARMYLLRRAQPPLTGSVNSKATQQG